MIGKILFFLARIFLEVGNQIMYLNPQMIF